MPRYLAYIEKPLLKYILDACPALVSNKQNIVLMTSIISLVTVLFILVNPFIIIPRPTHATWLQFSTIGMDL